jgi:hypothetical protein
MALELPAQQNDFPNDPPLRQSLLNRWNDSSANGRFLGTFIGNAATVSSNYVDPRVEPPVGTAVGIAWNGFPKLLSRWYDDGSSDAAKDAAERAADVATPIVYWFDDPQQPEVTSAPLHWLPYYMGARDQAMQPIFPGARFAAPARMINSNGTLGRAVTHLRRQQDEYLEWHEVKDNVGRLKKFIFTAEAPDYWTALAETTAAAGSGRLLDLYRELVGPAVQQSDLFHQTDLAIPGPDGSGNLMWLRLGVKGQYDDLNRWTTSDGLVHLTHAANTLGAEVRLAAEASVLWSSDLTTNTSPIAPEIRRIACGGYGGINRSSDPLIGKGVGDAIIGKARVTLTDPIGLYVADVAIDGLTGPNGQAVGRAALRITRGDTSDPFEPRILRFEIELPAGTPFHLDDCIIDGRKLMRGGQIARKVAMQLYANTYPNSANSATPAKSCGASPCRNPANPDVFIGGGFDLAGTPLCPNVTSLRWLTQTPYEGPAPGPTAGPASASVGVSWSGGKVETKTNLPARTLVGASRADRSV